MSFLEILARLILVVLAYVGAVVFPYWFPLVCVALLAIRFRAWEVAGVGVMMDFLWVPAWGLIPVPLFTIMVLLILWMFEPLRSEFLFS